MIEKDAPQLRLRNKPFFARQYLRIREKIRQLIGKIEIGTDVGRILRRATLIFPSLSNCPF